MPTLTGSWVGSGYGRARIECTYSATAGDFDADLYIATENRLSDSNNSWKIGGDLGSKSGSNLNINHSSGGGRTKIGTVSKNLGKKADISCSVSGIEYVGSTVSAEFTLDPGTMKPTIDSAGSRAVEQKSFVADLIAWTPGGTINKTMVQWNTKASTTGADSKAVDGAKDISITGLSGGTKYYFRMRLSNTQHGWGDYTDWMSVVTSINVPVAPESSWSVTKITQNSAETTGCAVSDDGGSVITAYEVQYNTSQSATGAISKSASSNPKMTGLDPNTVYHARIRAKNIKGWGAYTDWKSFRTFSGTYVLTGGSHKAAEVYVKWGGTWKLAQPYVRVSGVWK